MSISRHFAYFLTTSVQTGLCRLSPEFTLRFLTLYMISLKGAGNSFWGWTTPPLRCNQVKKPNVNGGRIGRKLILSSAALLEKTEAGYFRASSVNMVFDQGQGSHNNHDDPSLSNNGISSNLAEIFEADSTIVDVTKESIVNGEFNAVDDLEKMTVVKLKSELEKYGFEKKRENKGIQC